MLVLQLCVLIKWRNMALGSSRHQSIHLQSYPTISHFESRKLVLVLQYEYAFTKSQRIKGLEMILTKIMKIMNIHCIHCWNLDNHCQIFLLIMLLYLVSIFLFQLSSSGFSISWYWNRYSMTLCIGQLYPIAVYRAVLCALLWCWVSVCVPFINFLIACYLII